MLLTIDHLNKWHNFHPSSENCFHTDSALWHRADTSAAERLQCAHWGFQARLHSWHLQREERVASDTRITQHGIPELLVSKSTLSNAHHSLQTEKEDTVYSAMPQHPVLCLPKKREVTEISQVCCTASYATRLESDMIYLLFEGTCQQLTCLVMWK